MKKIGKKREFYPAQHNPALRKSAGFTLLEMVTTISIVTLLVTMGVPPFLAYSRHNAVRQSAQDTRNFLLEAQSLAKNPRSEDKGKNGKDYYYARIDYRMPTNPTIELGAGVLKINGRPMPWDESLGDKIRRVDEVAIKERRELGNDVDVQWIRPNRLDPGISTFSFLVPSGKILFDYHEPYPGLGYSLKCQTNPENCFFSQKKNKNAEICLWLKDTKDYEDYLQQLIKIDGHGGAVEIKENENGVCQ